MAISTRLHGLVDYAAAVSLGGLAVGGGLSGGARQVAALATVVPVGYFLLTDYEAGLVGWLSMRRHLQLDVVEGLLLCGAGLMMRRQPPAARMVLAAYGLGQFLLGLSTASAPVSGPGQGSGPLGRLMASGH